jgi:hypothetical protein
VAGCLAYVCRACAGATRTPCGFEGASCARRLVALEPQGDRLVILRIGAHRAHFQRLFGALPVCAFIMELAE